MTVVQLPSGEVMVRRATRPSGPRPIKRLCKACCTAAGRVVTQVPGAWDRSWKRGVVLCAADKFSLVGQRRVLPTVCTRMLEFAVIHGGTGRKT